ncbi:MAG: hypothetical protein JWN58_1997 [Gammaproteobacteria bacterium]|nr:hypothetical protein [Gammaproteobacteria bacterium]
MLPLREFRPPSQIGASVGVSQRVSPSSQISRQRGGGNIRAHARSTPGMDTTQKSALQISVFIVSDVRVHREGLAALLRDCPSIKVMGAHNLRDSQQALHSTAVDGALIDGALPSSRTPLGRCEKRAHPCGSHDAWECSRAPRKTMSETSCKNSRYIGAARRLPS